MGSSLALDMGQEAVVLYELVWLVFVLYVGLVLGSFATALIYRVPRKISWIGSFKRIRSKEEAEGGVDAFAKRSSCPHCHATLKWRDLIPVFSWLFSKGRCRHCSEKISIYYPLTELTTLAAVLLVYIVYGISWEGMILIVSVPFLVALLFIDLEHMILPNQLVGIVLILAALFVSLQIYQAPNTGMMTDIAALHVSGFFVYGLSIYLIGLLTGFALRKDALGMGDVKFFAVAGLWLGIGLMPVFFLMCGLLGVLFGVGWRLLSGRRGSFPFGPSLIAALYVILLANGAGMDMYEFLFGFHFF